MKECLNLIICKHNFNSQQRRKRKTSFKGIKQTSKAKNEFKRKTY